MLKSEHRLNILFIASFYHPYWIGGAERMLQIHMEGLNKYGHQISLLTLGPKSEDIEQSERNGISIFRTPIKNVYWPKDSSKKSKFKKALWHLIDIYNPRYNRSIDLVIDKVRPNIIICENIAGWSSAIWKHIAKKNIPIIQITHDYAFLCIFGIMYRGGRKCTQPCAKCKLITLSYRKNAKYVNEFIFVSKSQLDIFKKAKFPMQSASFLYNAESLNIEKKKKIWEGERPMKIGLLAALSESKGVYNLIKAFKLLNGNFELYLGGEPISEDVRQRIIKEIGTDNRITLCGYVESSKFFKNIDLTVAPTLSSETFGLVAIESCAKQVPVIASKFGGLSEIIKDGVNGLYCTPSDVTSIASSIQRLYDNPSLYKKLCHNTINSVGQFASTDKMLSDIEQICYKHARI